MSDNRDSILRKIRKATSVKSVLPEIPSNTDEQLLHKLDSITPNSPDTLLEQFKNELIALSAEFHLISNKEEALPIIQEVMSQSDYSHLAISDNPDCLDLANHLSKKDGNIKAVKATDIPSSNRKTDLAEIPAALVKATHSVADIGSLVFPYDDNGTTLPHFLADCIFALVDRNRLVANQFELFKIIDREKAKNMVFVAGPSRTADIEKVLVLGAHGPRRLIVFMIDQ
jgi:L-lactate dehydrogenase complex protein LldG